ncbi:unnamed protein product [Rotaria sordida]|uniref:Uncharacterized protein n=1 Tax=Rotaria sordida TaxID=392033 RepID=A0A818QQY2_9BILA|nr:unnamed protein product [Rotaria sordida]CAF3556915.1 unnamed protein product [Rotaria sordida]CAF3638287.1 unnamed protein product [Rotaria sordida]
MFIPLCISDTPYLLRSYPNDSIVTTSSFINGPCLELVNTLSFLQGTDEASLYHTECLHNSEESILTCKLGLKDSNLLLDLEKYPLNEINVVIIFVQEFPEKKIRNRVLDLCFLNRFGTSLRELAICGYKPEITKSSTRSYLHILDIPALAIVASKIQTLLISGINIWQSVELRQFKSLKHLLILQGQGTIQMRFYHTPLCADCEGAHPPAEFSFHYLIPLSSQLIYFLYDSPYKYKSCTHDLLKKIKLSSSSTISTFIIASQEFYNDENNPICQTCASGLCPLLSVCLDENSQERRKKDEPFECLCVEELEVEDEFKSCDPMTIHPPMYSTRCNHTPSIWNYITLPIIILVLYILLSIIVFIISTIFLIKSNS